jgi:hypothetical protein
MRNGDARGARRDWGLGIAGLGLDPAACVTMFWLDSNQRPELADTFIGLPQIGAAVP